MRKVRIGILLIILSWLPVAQVVLYVAHNHNHLKSGDRSQEFRLLIWGLQFVIGLIGLWLVGKLAVESARRDGWRQVPKNLWRLFSVGPAVSDKEK